MLEPKNLNRAVQWPSCSPNHEKQKQHETTNSTHVNRNINIVRYCHPTPTPRNSGQEFGRPHAGGDGGKNLKLLYEAIFYEQAPYINSRCFNSTQLHETTCIRVRKHASRPHTTSTCSKFKDLDSFCIILVPWELGLYGQFLRMAFEMS